MIVEELFESFFLFLLLAAVGDIIVERSGVLNLGIDGFITLSFALCYSATIAYGPVASLVLVLVAGALYALLIALFVNLLHSSHVLTGLVTNMVFYGLSVLIGYWGLDLATERGVPRTLSISTPLDWRTVLALSILAVSATWVFLYRTRIGTAVRACGYNPRSADYLGVNVWRTRLLSLVLGYIIIALGGYVYVLFYSKAWTPYIGMGYGFLALALAISSLWHPLLIALPTVIFSYLLRSLYVYQLEYGISQYILSMIPYLASIIFITAVIASPLGKKLPIPKALGEIYYKEERAA
uniref:ABC transporter permease n=1 Tax=Fervidicoccus fontis TaxID=683846 RepID=A0A7C1E3W5_9CREN